MSEFSSLGDSDGHLSKRDGTFVRYASGTKFTTRRMELMNNGVAQAVVNSATLIEQKNIDIVMN
jgi:hypothetical protein